MELIRKCKVCNTDMYLNTKQYTVDEADVLCIVHEKECVEDHIKAMGKVKEFLLNKEHIFSSFITNETWDNDFKYQFEVTNYGVESYPADKSREWRRVPLLFHYEPGIEPHLHHNELLKIVNRERFIEFVRKNKDYKLGLSYEKQRDAHSGEEAIIFILWVAAK